ncbi:MAG: phosphoenolpyruvate carboxykinase domain-containing protein, partial [Planctomycetota bacterium]
LDFVSIPLGQYIQNNLDFANGIDKPPLIFSVNYFLKGKDGRYLNGMMDKKVWILWAELRVHGDVDAIETPTGLIPKYEDLAELFKRELNTDYTNESYVEQFTIRVGNLLSKIDRIEEIYRAKVSDTPQIVFDVFNTQRQRLNAAKERLGEYISPFDL